MIKFFKWTKILNKNFCLFKINLKIIVLYLFAVELFDWILKVDVESKLKLFRVLDERIGRLIDKFI